MNDRKIAKCWMMAFPILLFSLLLWGPWKTPDVWAKEGFYKGKTVRIIVCCTPGGFYDRWARLLSRYMPKYVPGNPDFIVQNMPGAAGLIALNYVYNVAKQDGRAIAMPLGSTYLDQVSGRKEVRFDVRKLNWIGTQEVSNFVLYTRADSPYKTIQDLIDSKVPAKAGSTGTSGGSWLIPKVLEKAVGAKFKMVLGYRGGSEVDVAVQRGEVNTRGMTIPPHFGRQPFLTWHKEGFDHHLVQTGKKRDRRLPKTPTIYEVMDRYKSSQTIRKMAQVIFASGEFGRPFAVGPGVPADRVKILRQAYTEALNDPKLRAEAKKGRMDIEPSDGKKVQALAQRVINQPPEVIQGVRKILGN